MRGEREIKVTRRRRNWLLLDKCDFDLLGWVGKLTGASGGDKWLCFLV